MGRRQLSKAELIAKMRQVQEFKKKSYNAPFTGVSVICNYVLWKEENWEQEKLAEYNQRIADYDVKISNEEIYIDELKEAVVNFEKDIDVEYREFTRQDTNIAKGAFLKEMERQLIDVSNTVNAMSNLYFTIHYKVLIDMGFNNEFLKKNQDLNNQKLAEMPEERGRIIMLMRQELIDEAGIQIEMPN